MISRLLSQKLAINVKLCVSDLKTNLKMTILANKQIRHLRSLAHDTKPVVIVGDKGLTPSVMEEIANSLEIHELIKVKIRTDDREERQTMIDKIVKKTNAQNIQRVGHIVTLFKRNNEAKIALPKK